MADINGSIEGALQRKIDRLMEINFDPASMAQGDELTENINILMGVIKESGFESIPYLKAALRRLEGEEYAILTDEIPTTLAEYGLKKATMSDGTEVGLEEVIETHTVDKEAMAAWLESIGAGDLIKDTISLGKGLFDERLKKFLADNKYAYKADSDCAAQTLKKAIRDRYAEMGTEGLPPPEAVEVKPYTRAKIKVPKPEGF